MKLPWVSREHFDDVRADFSLRIAQLEMQNKELQARYDELRRHADDLALAAVKEIPEAPEVKEMHFPPTLRDVKSWATEEMRKKATNSR